MISKNERVRIDVYDENGIKTMDAYGLYDLDELSTEMVKALASKRIPVVRRAAEDRAPEDKPKEETEGQTEYAPEAESMLSMKWKFDGVEFAAEGPSEYVLRASAELLEYLEALT